jgi:hypothetical protein
MRRHALQFEDEMKHQSFLTRDIWLVLGGIRRWHEKGVKNLRAMAEDVPF